MDGHYETSKIGPGWVALAEALRDELAELPGAPSPVVGIDTFGLVTFSVKGPLGKRRDVQRIIDLHTTRALTVCERCGGRGSVRSGGVVTVRCNSCMNDQAA